jgi:hypothetical protein
VAANFLRKYSERLPVGLVRRLGGLWFPYLGAGIRIAETSDDYRYIRVELKRRWWNSNYVGTQFGGSIYAMTDPFYMLMLIQNLGRDYIVWDKAAKVDFLKPGLSALTAEFRLDQSVIDLCRARTDGGEKFVFDLPVNVVDRDGVTVATVLKTLYVRRKRA